MSKRLKVFFHDNCFDGTASAAVFSAFYRDHVDPSAQIIYEGMQHSTGDPFAGRRIDGDDNACVDFRYSPAPQMTWWFDHHPTAFQPPSLREHYLAHRDSQKVFDPAAPSCTGLMLRELSRLHGWTPPKHLGAIATWADVIDTARFQSAADAISLAQPAQRLAAWIAAVRDPVLLSRYIDELSRRSHEEVAEAAWLTPMLSALEERQKVSIELVARRATRTGEVVTYDLTNDGEAHATGFVGYYLFPDARYTISLSRSPQAVKISVGHNPWYPEANGRALPDIGAICERFGGGGHAVVGGVTLPPAEVERARAIAASIRDILCEPSSLGREDTAQNEGPKAFTRGV